MPSADFLNAIKNRRTIYTLSKESTVPDEKIQSILSEAILHVPSSFNSQSGRVVLLLNQHHDKLWDITTEILRSIVPADQFPATQQRMNGFKNAYGTILFFEDQKDVETLQKQFPTYQDRFPQWSQHSNGMLQFAVWTALENEGLGASLQHYNPLIDAKVREEWGVPETWQLISQMPFGKPTAPAGEKTFKPVEERVKVFN